MAAEADAVEAEGEEQEGAGGGGRKKLILVAVAVVLLLIAGGAGVYVLDIFGGGAAPRAPEEPAAPAQRPVVFYDLPEMTVNLSTDGRATYLKVRIALEVQDRDAIAQIEPFLPRILDAFQVYLRELRPADLEGSSGLFRLKEELLRRINTAVYPARVDGVLFKEILVQ